MQSDTSAENPSSHNRVLIVDDEAELTHALCDTLSSHGYETAGFTSAADALRTLQTNTYEVMLADLMMPDMDGVTLLKRALEIDPYLIGMIMTGQGTVQTAVEAIKSGAYDYILKPFRLNTLLTALERCLEVRRLRTENVQLRELLHIYQLGQVVGFTLEIDVIFAKTMETALEQCQADEVSIMLPSQDMPELELVAAAGNGHSGLVGEKVPLDGTIAGWVARHAEPVLLQGAVRDERFRVLHPRPEIQSAISTPMMVGNQLVGVVNVNITRRQNQLTPGQIKALHILGNIAASALENARLYEAVRQELAARRQRERELKAVASVSASLRDMVFRDEMLPAYLQEVCALFNTRDALLALYDETRSDVGVELGSGHWKNASGIRLSLDGGVTGQVMRTGRPARLSASAADVDGLLAFLDPRVYAAGDLQQIACLPLSAQDRRLGVLWIARPQGFSSGDLKLLASLNDIAASCIQRAGLFDQTEKRLHQLTALRTIDLAITANLDLKLTLEVLLEQVVAQLAVDAAAVLLMEPGTLALVFAAGRGLPVELGSQSTALPGIEVARRAAQTRGLVHIARQSGASAHPAPLSGVGPAAFSDYIALPLIAKGEVEGVLQIYNRTPYLPGPERLEFLEALAGQAAIAIDNARLFTGLQHSNRQLTLAYDETIEGWSRALDLRDHETEGHTQRVTEMTVWLCRSIGGFSNEELVHIRRGALLHDIGKMGVPDHILLKEGPLTEVEWDQMRRHPGYAYQLLSPIEYLREALDIPYCHHEHWDGAGYPRSLAGDSIPRSARVFAVVDVWDALRSDRPYRKSWPAESVFEYIHERAGAQFDPQVVDAFLHVMTEH